jgi:hypothetical protein
MKDIIKKGSTNQSVMFALNTDGLTVTEFRVSYTRWSDGDGTSFTTVSNPLTALGSIITAHTDNAGIYMSSVATDGSKFLFRVDLPDAAFAVGADRVAISLFDDADVEVAHREYSLGDVSLNSLKIINTTTNDHALELVGNGTGAGLRTLGGATAGEGISASGGASGGHGILTQGNGTGNGINSKGGASGSGIFSESGSTSGHGIETTSANNAGHGVFAYGFGGGAATGSGIHARSGGGAANAITADGSFGTTGVGIDVTGGGTSGEGLKIRTTSGSGIDVDASGSPGMKLHGTRGLEILATQASQPGAIITGQTFGAGIEIQGGASASGIRSLGGATAGNGADFIASVGHGVNIVAGGTGIRHGANVQGADQGNGIESTGGANGGDGIKATSGAGANGNGITAVSAATNGNGASFLGTGANSGILSKGGDTGSGIEATSGSSNGHGIEAVAQSGTGGNGIIAQGDLSGASGAHGIEAVGEATGNDIKAKEIGTPYVLADGTTATSLAAMLSEMAEQAATAGTFDRTTDSLQAISAAAGSEFKKNVAFPNFPIYMVLSSDHVTPASGKVVSALVQQDNGAFIASTNAPVEIGNGVYRVNLTQAEMNADVINLVFMAADSDTRVVSFPTN